jgi:alpha-glucosidase
MRVVAQTATSSEPSSAQAVSSPGLYDPVADPQAVHKVCNARFTVLTPRLIRMEWADDGKFEDHASLVFLNRKLPVPPSDSTNDRLGTIRLYTDNLKLIYDGCDKFSPTNLSVTFELNGKAVTWHPGMPDTGNLQGTTRTLDGALGAKPKSLWVLVSFRVTAGSSSMTPREHSSTITISALIRETRALGLG